MLFVLRASSYCLGLGTLGKGDFCTTKPVSEHAQFAPTGIVILQAKA